MSKFVKGVYSPFEQRMIDEMKSAHKKAAGWVPGNNFAGDFPGENEVDKSAIRNMGLVQDYKNLLYRNENFAKNQTRWGGIIAPPFFPKRISRGRAVMPFIPLDEFQVIGSWFGEDHEWYKPIRPGDYIRTYQELPSFEILQVSDTERHANYRGGVYFYNQNGECVAYYAHFINQHYIPLDEKYPDYFPFGYEVNGPSAVKLANERNLRTTPKYVYTPEMVKAIDKYYCEEPNPSYVHKCWEDVEIGEELHPTIMGPVSLWDNALSMAGHFGWNQPLMDVRQAGGLCEIDPENGETMHGLEIHLHGDAARKLSGWYSETIPETVINPMITKVVTNWGGCDCFLRSYKWRKYTNTATGDTFISRGTVINKWVDKDGTPLVLLDCRLENIRGFITNAGPVVVELPSRKEMTMGGKLKPCAPEERNNSLNPEKLKPGDHVRVKLRKNNWEFPCEYPLAGCTGVILQIWDDLEGYFEVLMDGDVTTLDPRIPVGMAAYMLERI